MQVPIESASFMLFDVPLVKAVHIAKPRVNSGGDTQGTATWSPASLEASNVSIQHTIPPFAPTVCGLKKWVKFKGRAKRVGFTGGGAVSCPWTSHVRPWRGQ